MFMVLLATAQTNAEFGRCCLSRAFHLKCRMGTHQNGPSTLWLTGEDLQRWLNKHPFALGSVVRGRFGSALPFLFKVLSIGTALSI